MWVSRICGARQRRASLTIRLAEPEDYPFVISVVDNWWGGRPMSAMLPKLFFVHFRDTTFVAEEDGATVGFLSGFLSQSREDEAYIHFVGVHPDYRGRGVAKALYERFFDAVQAKGRSVVRCLTSPVNEGSISFHQKMGFSLEGEDRDSQGRPIVRNDDGRGGDRVLFVRHLS